MQNQEDLYQNIALRKPAQQSSLSRWSTNEGAGGGVNGRMPSDFAFHTSPEDAPWWELDLERSYPLERIVIHNRKSAPYQSRARTLRVDVSLDRKRWTTLHSGVCYFSGAGTGNPLVIPLDGKILCRYVRLSLSEHAPLHLAQVEVFVLRAVENVRKVLDGYGFNYEDIFRKVDPLQCVMPYALKATSTLRAEGPLIGLSMTRLGRFGNNLSQLLNAIILAEQLRLKYVQVFDFESFSLGAPVTIGGLTLLPQDAALPEEGSFLCGSFFYSSSFPKEAATATEKEKYELAQNVIFPLLDIGNCPKNTKSRELVIHIRSGDLFSRNVPHADYVQPPFSFYKRIVDGMISAKKIDNVCLVFEDRRNPCVGAMEAYLLAKSIPFRVQSGTLRDDIATLLDARHMVFGYGSFGHAICRLSNGIDSVHVFNDSSYANFPNIRHLTIVRDKIGGYIQKGQWRRTDAQLRSMVEYPEESLEFEDVR